MMSDSDSVLVAVPTFRRPELLVDNLVAIVRELGAVQRQGIRVGVVVIDNDPEASARDAVAELGSPAIRYVVEPKPGISAARNRALVESGDADFLCFIDDDEMPLVGWLNELIDVQRRTGAAAVYGCVRAEFDGSLDPWLAAGRFFERPDLPTGTRLRTAAAGNLLLDLKVVDRLGLRFADRFGLSGGEDTLFCRQLAVAGGKIVWCQESVVIDRVPRERMTREWVLKRSRSHGNTHALVALEVAESPLMRAMLRVRSLIEGGIRLLVGTGRRTWGSAVGSGLHSARGARTAYRGMGMVLGALSLSYQEYGRGRSRWKWLRYPRAIESSAKG